MSLKTMVLTPAMSMKFATLFTEHPKSIEESYCQHFFKALHFSLSLFVTAFACLVHAFLPFCFVDSASKNVTALYKSMSQRSKK